MKGGGEMEPIPEYRSRYTRKNNTRGVALSRRSLL